MNLGRLLDERERKLQEKPRSDVLSQQRVQAGQLNNKQNPGFCAHVRARSTQLVRGEGIIPSLFVRSLMTLQPADPPGKCTLSPKRGAPCFAKLEILLFGSASSWSNPKASGAALSPKSYTSKLRPASVER